MVVMAIILPFSVDDGYCNADDAEVDRWARLGLLNESTVVLFSCGSKRISLFAAIVVVD